MAAILDLAGLEQVAARLQLHVLEARVVAAKHCELAIAARLKSDALGQLRQRGHFGQGDVGERWRVGERQGFWQRLMAVGCPLRWYVLRGFRSSGSGLGSRSTALGTDLGAFPIQGGIGTIMGRQLRMRLIIDSSSWFSSACSIVLSHAAEASSPVKTGTEPGRNFPSWPELDWGHGQSQKMAFFR